MYSQKPRATRAIPHFCTCQVFISFELNYDQLHKFTRSKTVSYLYFLSYKRFMIEDCTVKNVISMQQNLQMFIEGSHSSHKLLNTFVTGTYVTGGALFASLALVVNGPQFLLTKG